MTTQPSRRSLLKAAVTVGAGAAVLPALPATPSSAAAIKHPGLLHTQADFDRMAAKVEGRRAALEGGLGQAGRQRPLAEHLDAAAHSRRSSAAATGQNYAQLYNDIHAAYQNALRWQITGDDRPRRRRARHPQRLVGHADRRSPATPTGSWPPASTATSSPTPPSSCAATPASTSAGSKTCC